MATQPNEAENTLAANKKRSNGRRKIPIEKIQDKARRHVTFSKRRAGLFKKAGQLSSLCGAEVAILTFSQKGRLFCFGHPNPDDVIRRYITGSDENEEIKRKIEEGQNWKKGFWWDEIRVDEMGLDELQQFKGCLLELRKNVVDKLTGANLSFSSNQMGGSVLGQGNPNPDVNVGNFGFDNALNVNNHSDGIMFVDQDGFMSGMNVVEEQSVVGKEFDQFPSISGGVELLNFNVMGDHHHHHHHHQIGRMDDQGNSLTYQDGSLHQVFDQYESGYF